MGHTTERNDAEMSTAIDAAREAEALRILMMLQKAIKAGKNIEEFEQELTSYIEVKVIK